MAQYLMKRLLQMLVAAWGASAIVFALMFMVPGNPAVFMLGGRGTPAQVASLTHKLGLDEPIYSQYVHWLGRLIHGDFGTSFVNGLPVSTLIGARVGVTVELAVGSMLVALLIGIPLGLASGLGGSSWISRAVDVVAALGIAIPVFWLGILFQVGVGIELAWLPVQGFVPFSQDPIQNLRSMALPWLTLGLGIAAILSRFLKSGIIETTNQPFVTTIRSRGFPDRVITARYLTKHGLIAVVTVLGLQIGALLGGAVLTEAVFNLPGLGSLMWTAMVQRDYFVIQAVALLAVLTFMIVNLATDMIYVFIDPRIRPWAMRGQRS